MRGILGEVPKDVVGREAEGAGEEMVVNVDEDIPVSTVEAPTSGIQEGLGRNEDTSADSAADSW